MKRKKQKKTKKSTSSFKSFEKVPFSETVKKKGKIYQCRNFFNRDMSWLSFNERVLFEALDEKNPLLERLRFINIFRSNNDEFFMKRVSLLITKIEKLDRRLSIDGRNPLDLYQQFVERVNSNWKTAKKVFNEKILPKLENNGLKIYAWDQLSTNEKSQVTTYFKENIFPILTPLAVDAGRPFPFISNLSKSIGVCVSAPKKKTKFFARVKIPTDIPQWIPLKSNNDHIHRFINIEDVINQHIDLLFPGMKIIDTIIFRVTRDASMGTDDDEVEDVLEWVEEGLKERKFSRVVRLEVDNLESKWILDFLSDELEVQEEQIVEMSSLIYYSDFSDLIDIGDEKLLFKKFKGKNYRSFESLEKSESVFDSIEKNDHLVHFPYTNYKSTVEKFLKTAANDPKVKAIKIVLYRTDNDGSLIDILIEAAENGKQVAVVIELKARFDEESNIKWANRLEDYGVHVTYGLKELKTHAKMILVVRQSDKKLKTFVNIGTGNFNSQTSKLYTDVSYFTAKESIAKDIVELFNFLTGRSLGGEYKKCLVAPFNMSTKFINHIQSEIRNHKAGKPSGIIAKMNSLEDPDIINYLYKASQEGVKITLIVRGFCSLKPGVKGLSENIKVFSLVGRLLEHSRIYYFRNGSEDKVGGKFLIGSSDWMSRNLHRRVELVVPIMDKVLKEDLLNILNTNLKDNHNVWELNSNGSYTKKHSGDKKINAHKIFMEDTK